MPAAVKTSAATTVGGNTIFVDPSNVESGRAVRMIVSSTIGRTRTVWLTKEMALKLAERLFDAAVKE